MTTKHTRPFINNKGKTRKNRGRKSPQESATKFHLGVIKFASNDQRWTITETKNNVKRWSPFHSTRLFGFAPLTRKMLVKNEPIDVYERQGNIDYWPTKLSDFDVKYTFTGSGEAEINGKIIPLSKVNIKKTDICIAKGTIVSKDYGGTLQVGPNGLVSTNLMNSDAFVKL